jgi:hypothetical protein
VLDAGRLWCRPAPAFPKTANALVRERALDAYTAMQRYFYRAADGSYAGT